MSSPDDRPPAFEPIRPRGVRRADPIQSEFQEIEATSEGNGITQFRHARENSYFQLVAMGASTFVFMLFVVSIMPLMHLTAVGNALWVGIGLVVLVGIGVGSQAVLPVTILRLSPTGIEIEQGTPTDTERATVAWAQLLSVDLEPVDPKDGRKGMQVRLTPLEGEPIDTMPGVDVGDLNALRRLLQSELVAYRQGRRT